MYQRFPSGGKSNDLDLVQKPPMPQSVLNAVRLMYAGAVVSLISVIISLTSTGALKTAIRNHYPHYTTSQVNHLYNQILVTALVSAAIGILLWITMAWANGKGMGWARIVSSVLFAFNTLGLVTSLTQPEAALNMIFEVLTWLIGLGAIVFLWRKESTGYFNPGRGE
jgi:hypothetical protein